MSHELEFKDGRASFFSVAQTAWHREGMVLATAPTFLEALELGRLGYTVEKRPTQYQCTTPDGDTYMKGSETAFVIVRTDTQRELGNVGKDYTPLQNLDAFRVLEPLIDQGLATIETGGVLRDGADAWMLTRWNLDKFGPVVREIFADEVVPYGLLANNHNGRRGVLLQSTQVRVCCANTMQLAEGETAPRISIRHSQDAKLKLIEAAESLWGGIIERHEGIAANMKALKARVLTELEFEQAVQDLIAPDPRRNPQFDPSAKLSGLVVERADRKRSELHRLWSEGKGHTGEPTAWFALQGAIEGLDHNTELWPTRGAWRTASLLDGSLRHAKDRVTHALVSLAAA